MVAVSGGLVTCEIIKVLQKPAESEGPCATLSWTWGYRCSHSANPLFPSTPCSCHGHFCMRPFGIVGPTKTPSTGRSWTTSFRSLRRRSSGDTGRSVAGPQGYLQQGYPVPQDSPGQGIGLHCEQGEWLFEQTRFGDDGDDNSNNPVQTPPIKYFLWKMGKAKVSKVKLKRGVWQHEGFGFCFDCIWLFKRWFKFAAFLFSLCTLRSTFKSFVILSPNLPWIDLLSSFIFLTLFLEDSTSTRDERGWRSMWDYYTRVFAVDGDGGDYFCLINSFCWWWWNDPEETRIRYLERDETMKAIT